MNKEALGRKLSQVAHFQPILAPFHRFEQFLSTPRWGYWNLRLKFDGFSKVKSAFGGLYIDVIVHFLVSMVRIPMLFVWM